MPSVDGQGLQAVSATAVPLATAFFFVLSPAHVHLAGMGDAGGDGDAELVAAAAAGDREAFAALLRRHYDRIHGLAWRITGSRADADDIVQDVCCALVEKIGSFRGEAKFSTWLTGITFNACRDFRRRRRSFSGFAEKLAVLAGLAAAPDGRDVYDGIWLKSAIARLKPACATRWCWSRGSS